MTGTTLEQMRGRALLEALAAVLHRLVNLQLMPARPVFRSSSGGNSTPEKPTQSSPPLRHWQYSDDDRATTAVTRGPDGDEEPEEPGQKRGIIRGRRIKWNLVIILTVILALVGNSLYDYFGPIRFMSSPVSNISSIPDEGDWPMAHRGPDRNAFIRAPAFKPLSEVKWRFDAGAPILSSPAVVDGDVFLSVMDGRVISLNEATGKVNWVYPTGELMRSSPAVAGELVIVGVEDGRVIALNRGSGELQWEFKTEKPVLSSPVVYEGVVYIGSNDWRIYALDAATGKQRWSFKSHDTIQSGPAVNSDVVTFTDLTNRLYVLDRDTGKFLLDYKTAGPAKGGTVMQGNRVYLADRGGRVRAVDWTARDISFEKALLRIRVQLFAWKMISSLPDQKGSIWFARKRGQEFSATPVAAWGNVYAASESGTIFALDQDTGEEVWEFQAENAITTSPSVVETTLLVGDTKGWLYAVDSITGSQLWNMQFDSAVTSTPVFANGILYLTTEGGSLYALN